MKVSNNEPLLTRQYSNPDVVLTYPSTRFNPVLTRQLKLISSKGVAARAMKTTPEQRKEIASKAAQARWHIKEENDGPVWSK